MFEAVSQVTLTIDSLPFGSFKSITLGEEEKRKQFKLMGQAGTHKVTGLINFSLEYVVPIIGQKDWDALDAKGDWQAIVKYIDGGGIQYDGVQILSIGEAKLDGENETTRTIKCASWKRTYTFV